MHARLFFTLSGEHPTLPRAEVVAILDAYGLEYAIVDEAFKLLILDAPVKALYAVASRGLMFEDGGIQLYSCGQKLEEVLEGAGKVDFSKHLPVGSTFAVRVKMFGEAGARLSASALERKLGAIIREACPGSKVNLKSPDRLFLGVASEGKFMLGLRLVGRPKGAVSQRSPRRRPFFHPSTMQPKLARCIVNLARPKPGALVLDPFMGVGGIALEAGLAGCKVLGCDIQRRMVKGARSNLKFYQVAPEGLLVCDARRLPFRYVDAIVGDPPYGRGATTKGLSVKRLIKEFLEEAFGILREGGHICMVSPSQVPAVEEAMKVGFRIVEAHSLRVHKSLIRDIVVLRRG